MDRAVLSKLDWLKHAQEEAMDLVLYLEKLMQLESGTTAKVDTSVPARVITGKDIMPFGKHQGKFLEDVPSHYLAWILENVDGYEDLKLYIVDRIKNQ
jgi:hypothetical protein